MRQSILSAIDQRLTSSSRLNFQRSNVKIARAHGVGPSAILNVEWKDQYFSIDIVACVRGTDVSGLRYVEEVENFIHSVADQRLILGKPRSHVLSITSS